MASTDARPIPRKNVAYRVTFPIFDADGDLVTGATGLDSEVSKDAGAFADCTSEATEIATSSGMYYLDLTATEMDADTVAVIVKTTSSGAKTTPIVMYPEEAGDVRVDVVQISGDSTAADNAEAFFDGTGYAGTGNVIPTVTTVNGLANNVITAAVIATGAIDADAIADNAIDAGAIAADAITAAKIASDAITATKIASGAITSAKFAAGAIDAAAIADNAIDAGAIASDAITAAKIASDAITAAKIASGAITAAKFAAGAIDAAAIATDAIDADALAANAVAEIQSGLSTLTAAQVNTEVDTALSDINLDRLIKIAVNTDFATTVHLNSVMGYIADNGTTATFDRTTDSLEAIRDKEIDIETDTQDIQGRLPAALVSGRMDSNMQAAANGVITAAVIATDAIDADAIADNAINAASIAADAITSAKIADGAITAAKIADGAIDAATFASGAITADAIAADAIGSSELAASAVTEIQSGLSTLTAAQVNTEVDTAIADVGLTTTITGRIDAAVSTRATPAQVNTEVLDVLTVDTFAEPSAVPAATSTLKDKLNWLFALARNKRTTTSSVDTLRNDADNGTIATASLSDDATTFTRAEYS